MVTSPERHGRIYFSKKMTESHTYQKIPKKQSTYEEKRTAYRIGRFGKCSGSSSYIGAVEGHIYTRRFRSYCLLRTHHRKRGRESKREAKQQDLGSLACLEFKTTRPNCYVRLLSASRFLPFSFSDRVRFSRTWLLKNRISSLFSI